MKDPPPPIVASTRLLEYAVIDSSIVYTERTVHYVGGKLLGRVPRLAVCQALNGPEICLFHCDKKWAVLGTSAGKTLQEVKGDAERSYSGLAGKWRPSPHTEEETNRFLEEHCRACSFCHRYCWEVEQVIAREQNDTTICNVCIDSFYRDIHPKKRGRS